MADLADTVDALARPLALEADLELIEVLVKGEGARTRVRVVVDRKGGVDVGSCQKISKALSRSLDETDPVAAKYTLEVTSPGIDRVLDDQRSFDRIEGRLVRAVVREDGAAPSGAADETAAESDRPATTEVLGTVTTAGPDAVELTDADGEVHALPYHLIVKATQELPW
jgi:ribosome maturation factor RimP